MRFHNLHALRAIAALSVVFQHLVERLPGLGVPAPSGGISIFFVLSAFLMARCCRQETPVAFLKRRAVRVVPLYWIATLAAALSLSAGPVTFTDLAADLLFLQAGRLPTLAVGWTLNCEMAFYALFAVCIALSKRPARIALLMLCIAGVGSVMAKTFGADDFPYAPRAIFGFAAGLTVAMIPRAYPPRSIVIAVPILLMAAFFGPGWLSVTSSAALVWVLAQIEDQGLSIRLGGSLGDASYAIYLTHMFVAMPILLSPIPELVKLVVGLVSAIALGICVHNGIDQPITQRLKRGARTQRGHGHQLYGLDVATALTCIVPDASASRSELGAEKL